MEEPVNMLIRPRDSTLRLRLCVNKPEAVYADPTKWTR